MMVVHGITQSNAESETASHTSRPKRKAAEAAMTEVFKNPDAMASDIDESDAEGGVESAREAKRARHASAKRTDASDTPKGAGDQEEEDFDDQDEEDYEDGSDEGDYDDDDDDDEYDEETDTEDARAGGTAKKPRRKKSAAERAAEAVIVHMMGGETEFRELLAQASWIRSHAGYGADEQAVAKRLMQALPVPAHWNLTVEDAALAQSLALAAMARVHEPQTEKMAAFGPLASLRGGTFTVLMNFLKPAFALSIYAQMLIMERVMGDTCGCSYDDAVAKLTAAYAKVQYSIPMECMSGSQHPDSDARDRMHKAVETVLERINRLTPQMRLQCLLRQMLLLHRDMGTDVPLFSKETLRPAPRPSVDISLHDRPTLPKGVASTAVSHAALAVRVDLCGRSGGPLDRYLVSSKLPAMDVANYPKHASCMQAEYMSVPFRNHTFSQANGCAAVAAMRAMLADETTHLGKAHTAVMGMGYTMKVVAYHQRPNGTLRLHPTGHGGPRSAHPPYKWYADVSGQETDVDFCDALVPDFAVPGHVKRSMRSEFPLAGAKAVRVGLVRFVVMYDDPRPGCHHIYPPGGSSQQLYDGTPFTLHEKRLQLWLSTYKDGMIKRITTKVELLGEELMKKALTEKAMKRCEEWARADANSTNTQSLVPCAGRTWLVCRHGQEARKRCASWLKSQGVSASAVQALPYDEASWVNEPPKKGARR